MPVMQNFRKIMERTRESYGLPASGQGANELPRVLRATRTERTPGAQAGSGHAGEHRCNGWCADSGCCAGGCGRKTEWVNRGEVLEVPDLWAADSKTSRDTATGRNRAGVRREGCTASTPLAGQENRADSLETATAGCF